MQKKSFHRAILPWVFVIAFFAIAPAVVFYTAGYRWNPKKGAIERNGTLIIDTRPGNARITLNGEAIGDGTPVTLQNTAPGTYEIRLDLEGRHSWQKTLDIRPELVTFVSDVQLWADALPERIIGGNTYDVAASPNGRWLAYLSEADGTFETSFFEIGTGREQTFSFGSSSPSLPVEIRWSDDSSSVYLRDRAGASWLASRGGRKLISLPDGSYRWDDGILVGSSNGERSLYDVANDTTERVSLPANTLDVDGAYSIVSVTGTDRLALTDASKPDRRYELPGGDWRFGPTYDGMIFLVSDHVWLGFNPDVDEPAALTIPIANDPTYMRLSGEDLLLSHNEGEIWLTLLGQSDPELLVRKSGMIQDAVWFRRGTDIFFSTDKQVIALNLDPRDGRMETVLAEFDEVRGIAMADRELYISAAKGEEQGVFRLVVE